MFGPVSVSRPLVLCSYFSELVLWRSRAIKFVPPSLDTQSAEEQRTQMSIELELRGMGVAGYTRSSTETPRSLDSPGHQRAGPLTQGALLPPGARLRRCGRRGCRRRVISRCTGVAGPGRRVRGGGPRRLRRVDRTGVGCGGILEPGLLGGAALLPGLLKVADGVRVQCELLVLRTSESLEPRQELICGGERPASKEQGSY